MTFLLTTGNGMNLNDGAIYKVLDFSLGDTVVDESWIESMFSEDPILAKRAIRKTKMFVDLRVNATSMAQLMTRVKAVRDEFNGNNTVSWAYDGGTPETVITYQSTLPPVDVTMGNDDGTVIPRDFDVIRWHLEIWRKGVAVGDVGKVIVL